MTTRTFLLLDDVRDPVTAELGADRGLIALDRLTGGSKKGVYLLRLDDRATVILYVWGPGRTPGHRRRPSRPTRSPTRQARSCSPQIRVISMLTARMRARRSDPRRS